jgi:hypothetical protein
MTRTQIYLTKYQHEALRRIAAQSGKKQSEVIREAVDEYLDHHSDDTRAKIIENTAGVWRERTDLSIFREIRKSADRKFG